MLNVYIQKQVQRSRLDIQGSLWIAVKYTASGIKDCIDDAQTCSELTQMYTTAEAEEAEHNAVLLVETLLPLCSQSLESNAQPYLPGILCEMLGVLLASSNVATMRHISQSCAAKVVQSGENTSCFVLSSLDISCCITIICWDEGASGAIKSVQSVSEDKHCATA